MKKKIVKGNEKIVRFLDLKVAIKRRTAINPTTGRAMKCSEDVKCYLINGEWKRASELKYHSSWNWIMPVVEKIEKIGETDERYGTIIDITTTHVKINNIIADRKRTGESIIFLTNVYVDWTEDMTKLDAVWACIVKYLE